MKKFFFTLWLIAFTFALLAQNNVLNNSQTSKITSDVNKAIVNNYQKVKTFYENAYQKYPAVPLGMLEAVAFTNSRFFHITHNSGDAESCIGLPKYYGVMGLVKNGKNYFRNNLIKVSELSGISVNDIIQSPEKNIMAYAAAYSLIKTKLNVSSMKPEAQIPVLIELSELPVTQELQDNFALNSHLYSVYYFLNTPYYQSLCGFSCYQIDFINIFGEDNYKILSSPHIIISDTTIINTKGIRYQQNNPTPSFSPSSTDYPPALWDLACTDNFTYGRSQAVSAVTIHDVEGSYAGCISWFNNCTASVSAHYVLRSSDGQITQMVAEADKAWHVGSENPYTIGFEHEGYASQTGWYTVAMYTASAALSSDICVNSGYGINPVRTGFWPWLATTYYNVSGIPGSCCKIKGHQHYPNQTHTDPGPNWNWDYYYKLINNSTTATTLTTATGNFYDSGGSGGNYADDERKIWVISPTGASSVILNFSSFNIENTWDYLYIYDGTDVWAPLIGYYTGTSGPGTVTAGSGSMTIEFRSDCSTTATGWAANWTSLSPDNILPTTSISTPNTWETADFTATFTDADNIGVEKSFYQVLDFDGTYWGANANNGFFADNFDILHTFWTNALGVWNVNTGELTQTDEAEGNSNIYSSLNQNLSNRYLYHFTAKVNSTSANRRFGFHFFSDDASLPNRGNSYFVWFRIDDQSLQFYKVQSDVFTPVNTVTSVVTNVGQYYDYKITYDRISGKIVVWRDNVFLGSWIDTAPYSTNGNFISFRTGNCSINVNELKVYRSRYPSVTVTMGDNTKDIRYQNPNPTTFGAKIKSIVVDANNNLSAIAYHDLNIDWTAPSSVSVNDGTSNDVDTIFDNTTASAVWTTSNDPNSGISEYWYALGTSPGATDIVNWTNNGANTNLTVSGLSLNNGSIYYFSVKSKNGADLWSNISSSDGFVVLATNILDNNNKSFVNIYPNPFTENINIVFVHLFSGTVSLTDVTGRIILSENVNRVSEHNLKGLSNLKSGIYIIQLKETNGSTHCVSMMRR